MILINRIIINIAFSLFLMMILVSCNDNETINEGIAGEFGLRTSLVVVVNPYINQGSSTTIEPGTQREGIMIKAGTLPAVTTNSSGLAIITDIPVNSALPVIFPTDTIYINVVQEKELYDLVVSYKDDIAQEIFPVVRYPIGGEVVILDSTDNISDYVNQDNAIIVIKPGTYFEQINITATNVLLFGTISEDGEVSSKIVGQVTVSGGNARLRGLYLETNLTVNANNFEAAFCVMNNATIKGNSILLLRNTFSGGNATVTSSNSILVDNIGIP